MNKLILLICFITTFFCTSVKSSTSSVQLIFNPSTDTNVIGYKIYYGTTSQIYTTNIVIGNTTNTTLSGFPTGTTYYFAATAYDSAGDESVFSNEAVWTNIPPVITYVGVEVDYATSLTSIYSKRLLLMSVTNNPGYFYNEQLVITNNPLVGLRPADTNNYTYIGTIIKYGESLTTLNTAMYQLIIFTNPPIQYYRSSLIITNNPF